MAFIPSFLKSVQQFNVVISSNAQAVTISPVVVANTALVYNGCCSNDASGNATGAGSTYIFLSNTTTVLGFQYTPSGSVSFTVLEFYSGFLRQPVQYVQLVLDSLTNKNATITAVGPKAFLLYNGYTENSSFASSMASQDPIVVLTSTTNISAGRFSAGAGHPDLCTVACCVVDPV